MTDNEAVFRTYNERITNSLDDLKSMADQLNESENMHDIDTDLHFYCECSNERCQERIQLTPLKYEDIHKTRDHFIVKPSHDVASIETVISRTSEYSVVEKQLTPPESPTTLHQTGVSN